jgi:hypothetical protein
MGYVYAQSDVRTVVVTGKHTEETSGRSGRTGTRYVIETAGGRLPLLKFPIIGYGTGAEEAYKAVTPGQQLKVRVGFWPPVQLGAPGKPHIMAIY